MFQNIRVDIAYYKTGTDFEMEFNLCGCCRMRLLTDKAPDKKTLVHSLARAVSRSRVIIIVGNLFGADGIVNIAAGATGTKLCKADNKAYGISSDDEIEIINGSTPLVTPEGYFGGCIIEKGPQTMILLTENKNVRKSIMKNLIHPYIEELCASELKEKAAATTDGQPIVTDDNSAEETDNIPATAQEEAPVEEPTAETEPENIEDVEETETATEPEPEIELDFVTDNEDETIPVINPEDENVGEEYNFVSADDDNAESNYEDDMDLVTDDDYEEIEMKNSDSEGFSTVDDGYDAVETDLLYSDKKSITYKEFKRRNEEYYNNKTENFEDLVSEDEDYQGKVSYRSGLGTPILIISILLLIVLIVLCYCIFYVPSTEGVSATGYIKEVFDTLFG